MRWMLVLGLFAGTASSCARVENGPEDPQAEQPGAESSTQELAALPVGPAGAEGPAAHVVPGSRLDRQQLAALVGDQAAAAVGSCVGLGVGDTCADPIFAVARECGGFTNGCDSTGTEDVIPINFFCVPDSPGLSCAGVVGRNQVTRACTVPTDGKSCGGGCGNPFCAAYPSQCADETNQVHNCLTPGTCSHDTCSNQIAFQEIVGTCERDTEGNSCAPTVACKSPKIGLCNTSGNCACLLGPQ
jgi:hypothetical protein